MKHLEQKYQETNYLQSYEKSLKLWPTSFLSYFVETSQGKTHIIESGNKLAQPLVLLHGAKMSSTMWYPNILHWSNHFRIICIDILGDKNKSVLKKGFTDRLSYALWLKEVLHTLEINNINIVGVSYGALHTVNFLTFFQEKINKAVIMSPAATYIPFHPLFFSYAAGMVNSREGVVEFLDWIFDTRYTIHPFIQEQLIAGMMWNNSLKNETQIEQGFPYIFTDQELSEIKTPMLLMLGEDEVMYNPLEAFKYAEDSSPNLTVELVKDVGHLMSMENPQYINDRILEFFNK
ncbi:hydrolase, alpha/beta hydrolase fold family, putative (plasmid) [Bacillus cereus Q1]|uniref:Hydrolase, alpha/beta hydrolase fold family, putative n=1 Tax=Bacillus cereus (strain Q1) TaxID=361100 RepID=B9J5X3_BACCQ|nr:alpha/beta hydrolase [Bacillus paranthracis]ACM15768.1 hydrolase, alpha/beta hydrolase fold family, putative [Bacillus cereus Q1]MED1613388.1 alpha/beta hydrolase [Bacillus paranthracis]MED1684954.1 alpha/beta hydrolase [Bacillus paranthracis]